MGQDRNQILKRFGKAVAELRRVTGLSQEALAERSGLHRTYVGAVERGERNPTIVSITALASGLGYPPAVLVERASRLSPVPREEADPYGRHLPLYTLEAAAGRFLANEPVEEQGWVEVHGLRLREGMFVARAVGKSMEPRIPDASYCVFRGELGGGPLAGSRGNKIVLAALYGAEDPEGGGRFTIKRYRSTKSFGDDDTWTHERIVLESDNKAVPDIEFAADDEPPVIIAEFIDVLEAGRLDSVSER